MVKKAKEYRRFIRVNGVIVPSPRFETKKDADDWYDQMKRRKNFGKHGLKAELLDAEIPTFIEYSAGWLGRRMAEHPANTWMKDEERLRQHVLPVIGQMAMNKITPAQIKALLMNMKVMKFGTAGKRIPMKPSPSTQNKVKVLISGIFEDALEQDEPPVSVNPVKAVRMGGARKNTGAKLPTSMLDNQEAALKFLEAAAGINSPGHLMGRTLVYAAIALMAGPRKSEMIALRWRYVDFKNRTITFAWVYDSAGKTLVKRTKKGEGHERPVPMADNLYQILTDWRAKTPHSGPNDFVLAKPDGGHMTVGSLRSMHERLVERSGLVVSPHGLRHTFGRLFILKTGNLKALQELLGHTSIATTEVYAKLNAAHLAQFKGAMDLGFGATVSDDRHQGDTVIQMTPRKLSRKR